MPSSRIVHLFFASCVVAASLPSVTSFLTAQTATTSPLNLVTVRSSPLNKPTVSPWSVGTTSSRRNELKQHWKQQHVVYMTSDAALPADAAISGSDDSSKTSGGGSATVTELIFNLIKGIVGAGVLSLPAGIAAWGSAPSAVLPAVALIATIGGLSGYGFALIGRCCAYTNTESYRDAWTATVSEGSSWIPATAVTFKTICAILAYSMILGDTFVSLLSTAGIAASKVPVTVGLTGAVLLPLCLMKNLSSLAPFSLLGSLGMIYTAIAMAIRYFGKAYTTSGKFGMDMVASLRPKFGDVGASGILSPSAAILVGMLSTAYMAHFNAPKFYTELKKRTLPNYYKVVSTSFAASITIFALMAAIGFLTFGTNSSGLILNNYSTKDGLMSISRVAVAVSLVFSYPLAFVGARDGVTNLLKMSTNARTQNLLTVALLSAVTVAALIIPDVSFVLAFAGATLGNALIYIFPAFMFRGAIKKKADATKGQKREVKLAIGSAVVGTIMGLLGAKMAIASL
ncbi:transmembrane amino acid transporter [Nitzschia inconspicua]|uniref:Transmembrane amino acid transporter n=1 Tax=Nitzschia inconspicua TaxID=303405 RepID=A0A9K3Q1L8_9STRA|nr:transmembrane amino acid transporter [Nitzschia inconspicua]